MHILYTASLISGLVSAAVSDLKTRTVPVYSLISLLLSAAVNILFFCSGTEVIKIAVAVTVFIILFVFITLWDFDALGGGDMKLILLLTAAAGPEAVCISLLTGCSCAAASMLIARKKTIPLVPFILLGSVITFSGAILQNSH